MRLLLRERAATLAVLSYHSWEVSVPMLRDDVRELRRAGWTIISASDAIAFVRRERAPAARCVLITTDDGHVEDEAWAPALRELECPAVTFICSSLVPPERRAFYRQLAASGDFAVEDHGLRHNRHVSSSRVLGYAHEPTPVRATDDVLSPGEPILPTASEVESRRFDPDREAVALLARAGASASPAELRGTRWRTDVEEQLIKRRLAVRHFGRLFLRGRLETRDEYEARVTEYLRRGRSLFEEVVGRPPTVHAYTWWAGNETTDGVLRSLGYAGSFRGTAAMQRPDGRPFAIPRIPISPGAHRPLRLDALPVRPLIPRPGLAPLRVAAKRMLGLG